MKALLVIIGIIIVAAVAYGVFLFVKTPTPLPVDTNIKNMDTTNSLPSQRTRIETNYGTIVVELYSRDAPKAVANFIKLAEEGFYSGIKFHRVIKDFMIQGGDPLTKDDTKIPLWGTGGPGYQFEDELNPATKSYQDGYQRGVLAMANAGENTNGSQFFIMHRDVPLEHKYTIFGKVIEGMEVVDVITSAPVGAQDRPLTAVIIERISIIQ